MVAPNLLVSTHKSGLQSHGFMAGGTTPTVLGTSAGSEDWSGTNTYKGFAANRGVWFKGCYFWVGMNAVNWNIRVWDPVANTITVITVPSSVSIANSIALTCSGLYVTDTANPTLFFFAEAASQAVWVWRTTDGTNWTATFFSVGIAPFYGAGRGIMYRNQLFLPVSDGFSQTYAFVVLDPVNATLTGFPAGTLGFTTLSPHGSFCVFRNRVYMLRHNITGPGGVLGLYEFTGGTLVLRATLLTSNLSVNTYQRGDGFLFPVDDTKMVAVSFTDTGASAATRGSVGYDLVPTGPTTFTVTNKTTTLVPTALRRVADGGPGIAAETHRWTGFIDNDFNTVPGTPLVSIWHLSDNGVGGIYSYFEYVDSDTLLSPGTASLGRDSALPYQTTGGGDRTYAVGMLRGFVQGVGASPNIGAMRFQARVWGDMDPAASTVGGGFVVTGGGSSQRHAPVDAATLVALPSATYNNGAAGVGATLTGTVNGALPAIDGVTLVAAQRVLVKNQAAPVQNGVYDVTQVGSGGSPFILTRSLDADAGSYTPTVGISAGAWVRVLGGSQAGQGWYLRISNSNITFGTTALNFAQIPSLDRKLRLWYSLSETPDMVQATLTGTPTQGSIELPLVTRNVDALENVVADGSTIYTFDWNASGDAVQNGQPANVMVRVGAA